MKSLREDENITLERTVSQNLDLGLKPIFHQKTGWRRVKFASPNA